MAIKPKLYLETTIPSYLVSKPSRDLRLAADQEQTLEWWEEHRSRFEIIFPQLSCVRCPKEIQKWPRGGLMYYRRFPF